MMQLEADIKEQVQETLIAYYMTMCILIAEHKSAVAQDPIAQEFAILSTLLFLLLVPAKSLVVESRYITALQAGTMVSYAASSYVLGRDATASCMPPLLFSYHIARKNNLIPEIAHMAIVNTVQIYGAVNLGRLLRPD